AFVGIGRVAHLASGGEAPALRAHAAAAVEFLRDKSGGMPGRNRLFEKVRVLKDQLATLLSVPAADIALLAGASEGLLVAASGIDWREGDNVVVALSEFPSVLHAWRRDGSVEVRAVGDKPVPEIDEIAAAVDGRTRLIAASHVSYLTGTRLD